jgi:hypothetical protein
VNNESSSGSFLPISTTIASLIRQLHRDLVNTLRQRDTLNINCIEILKAIEFLVKATPYIKLRPGLIYKLITSLHLVLCQKTNYMNDIKYASNKEKSIDDHQNSNTLLHISLLNCLKTIISTHHELAEVHLALLAPINIRYSTLPSRLDDQLDNNSETIPDELSKKLEKLTDVYRQSINVMPSRVTYFYNGDSCNYSLNSSSLNSGQMTPHHNQPFSDFINERDQLDNSLFVLENKNSLEIKSEENKFKITEKKSWLLHHIIENASFKSDSHLVKPGRTICLKWSPVRSVCLDFLLVICRKYFDLMKRDLFFEHLCELILTNIDLALTSSSTTNGREERGFVSEELLQTVKLLEEFVRCLATERIRTMNEIDLNDCCKFWISLLNSKLMEHALFDEQQYLLSSTTCDCLASIGTSIFELLPNEKRIYCLTSMLHLTKSKSTLIRSSSIRALGVYVAFTSLKEDTIFLNDVSQCLLNLLNNDTNNLIRQKAAWSLSNLSEVLMENSDRMNKLFIDQFRIYIILDLLKVATKTCFSRESDKFKSYIVRALGNFINYISRIDEALYLCETPPIDINYVEVCVSRAIEALCQCKHGKMLKIKWNLSHAIGVAIKYQMNGNNEWFLEQRNPNWMNMFYDTLIELFSTSLNYKVRINACIALMTINLNHDRNKSKLITKSDNIDSRSCLEQVMTLYIRLWTVLIDAFNKVSNSSENNSTQSAKNEIQHEITLVHELCKLFTYLCKHIRINDLNGLIFQFEKCLKPNNTENSIRNKLVNHLTNYTDKIINNIESYKLEG